MTESEWLAIEDPAAMLELLTRPVGRSVFQKLTGFWPTLSDRKLRLFACACVRQVWHLVSEEYPRRCVAHAEGWADDGPYKTRCGDAASKYRGNASTGVLAKERFALATCLPDAAEAAREVMQETVRFILPAQHATLLREIAGSPFRPVKNWKPYPYFLDAELHALAQAAYDERLPDGTLDPARLAVLSDALEEAGLTAFDAGEEQRLRLRLRECPCGNDRSARRYCDDCETMLARLDELRSPHPILAHLRSPGPHVRGCWALDLLLGKE